MVKVAPLLYRSLSRSPGGLDWVVVGGVFCASYILPNTTTKTHPSQSLQHAKAAFQHTRGIHTYYDAETWPDSICLAYANHTTSEESQKMMERTRVSFSCDVAKKQKILLMMKNYHQRQVSVPPFNTRVVRFLAFLGARTDTKPAVFLCIQSISTKVFQSKKLLDLSINVYVVV